MEIAAAAQWSEAEQVPLGYARPSDTLAAEKNFSDARPTEVPLGDMSSEK